MVAFKSHLENIFPSYLSPFTSLSRVTLKPNFSQDDIIFSLSVCSQEGFSIGKLFAASPAMPPLVLIGFSEYALCAGPFQDSSAKSLGSMKDQFAQICQL